MESFHSVLKKEEIYLHTYQDSKEARGAVFEYIEGWYNRKRIHSAIGYILLRLLKIDIFNSRSNSFLKSYFDSDIFFMTACIIFSIYNNVK